MGRFYNDLFTYYYAWYGAFLIGLSIYRISTINISFFMLRIYIGRSSSCLAKKDAFWLPILF